MEFKTQPYAHQLKAFERFKDSEYFGLFMDMGTGKTKTVLDIAAHKFLTGQINAMLILAPNHVHSQWIDEQLPTHCAVPYTAFIWQSGCVGRKSYAARVQRFIVDDKLAHLKVFAVNIEALQSDTVIPFIADFVKLNKCLIVIDEATRIKHNTAKRTKVAHKLSKYGQRCILTGTPTAKSPFDLWSMMEFLKPNYFDANFFVFQHQFGILVKGANFRTGVKFNSLIDARTYAAIYKAIIELQNTRNGQLTLDDYEAIAVMRGTSAKNVRFIEHNPEFTQHKRLDELRSLIAKDVYSVKKEDCLDLPPKVYEQLYVDMSPDQAKVYKALKTDLLAEYAGHELSVQNKVALTLRLMQVVGGFFPYIEEREVHIGQSIFHDRVNMGALIGTSNTKLDALLADLDEVQSGTQIIIWAHFVAELNYIYAALKDKYRCGLYYGATSDYDRNKIITAFKAHELDIFIGNAATAGFGLNLQMATLQYYFSNSFRVEDRLQAEDRSHRIGVKSTVVYKDIIVKGTIDERVYQAIKVGRDMNDFFKSRTLGDLFADIEEDETFTF